MLRDTVGHSVLSPEFSLALFCVKGGVSPWREVMTACGLLPLQTSAQQALMGTINTSMHAVQQAQDDLSELDSLPPLGQDMVTIYGCHSVSMPGTKQGFAFCRYSAG